MILLLVIGLFGALTAGATIPLNSRRREISMGDTEDNASRQNDTARLTRFVKQTMALTNPQEVACRAKRLSKSHPQTAQIIMRRARELQASETAAKSPNELYQALKRSEPQAVFNLRWTKFLLAMVREVSDVSNGHVGYFYFAWPRLVYLKLATNLRKEENDKGRKIWTADLLSPPTIEEFLESSKLQYAAFSKSILDYLPTILRPQFTAFVGKDIEGKRVSISGLLAVAHVAGIEGLKSWLSNPEDREKYPNTTGAFLKATEIF
jgi:hypothetical protein